MSQTRIVKSIIGPPRGEYTSARLIHNNLQRRENEGIWSKTRRSEHNGPLPAEIECLTSDGKSHTIKVRDCDVRYLDRVSEAEAIENLNLIHQARSGDQEAIRTLRERIKNLHKKLGARFPKMPLVENKFVVPYTTETDFPAELISDKGAVLLRLARLGTFVPDLTFITSRNYSCSEIDRELNALDAIRNLEILSGRGIGDSEAPLLIAMRIAMPRYIPGVMPTYLNVGVTEGIKDGLIKRYGKNGAARIMLNSRKTLLEALDPQAFAAIEGKINPHLSRKENIELTAEIEKMIRQRDTRLLTDPHYQVLFLMTRAYDFYDENLPLLGNYMGKETHYPTVILQRMVCTVIDDTSYAGILYSRNPLFGTGAHIQYARGVYGEELMSGKKVRPEAATFGSREGVRDGFPAIFHFYPKISELEKHFQGPVMIEFAGVRGIFTLFQLNAAELTGPAMLIAVMDMYRKGNISEQKVLELIRPYHLKQVESPRIGPQSLSELEPFCTATSVLPMSAVTGRLAFSREHAEKLKAEGERVILAGETFSSADTIAMEGVDGILSGTSAAIHVVTTTQNLGIPALLDLERQGVNINLSEGEMRNSAGRILREGDPVTISSEAGTLYAGKAKFRPAKFLRFINGEDVGLSPEMKPKFDRLARAYKDYQEIVKRNVEAKSYRSLKSLGREYRYGELRDDPERASLLADAAYDINKMDFVDSVFRAELGDHVVYKSAFDLLTVDRQVNLIKAVLERCQREGLSGYQASAFVIGGIITDDTPIAFWEGFEPHEIALLINEWILHRKYTEILDKVGERNVNRARKQILGDGIEKQTLHLHKGNIGPFIRLKLIGVDLEQVKAELPEGYDKYAAQVIGLLLQPFGELYDYSNPRGTISLRNICEQEEIPLPKPEDI